MYGSKVVFRRFLFLIFLGFLLYYYLLVKTGFGDVYSAFDNPKAFRYAISNNGNAFFYFFMVKIVFLLPFVYFSYLKVVGKRVSFFCYFVVIVLLLILALPLGSKGVILSIFINFILIYNYFVKRLTVLHLLFFSGFGVVAFLYMQFAVIVAHEETASILDIISTLYERFSFLNFTGFVISRLDVMRNLDLFVSLFVFNDSHSSSYFFSFVSLFQQYIPRSLYPDKLYMFSPHMTKVLMPGVFNEGVTYDFSSIAESIYNFGVPLFFIPSIFSSFCLAFLNKIYFHNNRLIGFGFFYLFFARYPVSLLSSGFISTNVIVTLPLQAFIAMLFYFFLFKLRHRV